MTTGTNDAKSFAKLFDSSLLRATNRKSEYVVLCEDALHYGFACVAVNGAYVKFCADRLAGSGINITCATSFPLGLCTLETKLYEASDAINNGATDIDFVLNISRILDHDWHYIEKEVRAIVKACREGGILSKIIFETCFLSEEEIRQLCRIANAHKPDFIKTCTGTQGPATEEAVALMREESLPEIKIKASGGVHNLDRVEAMLGAGAERIGTVTARDIMRQHAEKYRQSE